MKINTCLKSLLAGAIATAGLVAAADPSVTVGEVTTGDPWSTITVNYTLGGVDSTVDYKVAFDVTAKGVTKGVTNAVAKLANQAYAQVIDTAELFGEAKADREAKVRVSLIAVKPVPPPENLYMIINLTADGNGKYLVTYEDMEVAAANLKFNTDTYKTDYLVLRKVKAGQSYPCAPDSDATISDTDTMPVAHNYWIGLFETTEAQYAKVMGGTVTDALNPKLVSYETIRGTSTETAEPTSTSFLGKLSANCVDADSNPVTGFELPTDAQWEIACRAGTLTRFCCDDSVLSQYAVYDTQFVHVGTKLPNAWGLYDMHGNVWEWCRDARKSWAYVATAESFITQADGGDAKNRIMRSGANMPWIPAADMPTYVRSSYRDKETCTAETASGFRLCRMAPAQ